MHMRLLIVEDEQAIAELEKDYLEMNNYTVEVALNGRDGLRKALEEDFDLVILDLMIPEVDGQTVCREIRREKDIPIIIVSAKKEDWDKVQLLGVGADDYMTKPFSPSELVARVKAHLSRYNRLVGTTHIVDGRHSGILCIHLDLLGGVYSEINDLAGNAQPIELGSLRGLMTERERSTLTELHTVDSHGAAQAHVLQIEHRVLCLGDGSADVERPPRA